MSTSPDAWTLVREAADHAEAAARAPADQAPNLDGQAGLGPRPTDLLRWSDGAWQSCLSNDDARSAILDLYLPVCSGWSGRPLVIGHLAQSLDGFIATHEGDSRWVTGHANILHLHRLRALCDAVVVGALTVASDDPQLTTRFAPGPNPLRVVFDPMRRLGDGYKVFRDGQTPTLYACDRSLVHAGETEVGHAAILELETGADESPVAALVRHLRARGCRRILVEGGGVTVSGFLESHLLDRLHLAVAPLLIGDGRPAVRLPALPTLDECLRPAYRVFQMGGDVLFDCDLRSPRRPLDEARQNDTVKRVL